ncbi:MAG: ATP-binding protein [candidate division KSB1 bacterium]|nr:ATP-binding protein [candidate division KSB1 bacterium]MDZ7304899.1 ATP-binding protein [candidate division KSB1 bacterium]MDZ7313965.1 ATP-binding protein [candidate division KSB1 bacterium]
MLQRQHKLKKPYRVKRFDDLRPASEEFLKSLHLVVGLDQLLENFSAKLREMFDAGTVYVVLFEPITNRYVGKKAKGDHAEWLAELNFSRSDNLIKWLNVNQCILEVSQEPEVIQYLSVREQELLQKTNSVLVVPLIVINRLTGALFVSKKHNGKAYSSEEIAVLSKLADQSALAIEHALMYQFQEDKLKKLFHADKLATVGELAAGAAHEIRNPLTSIRSTVQYVQKALPADKQPLIDGIIEEVDRIDQIIKGLLSFSKSSELHFETINLEEVLNQTLLLLDPEFRKHNIDVRKNFDPPHCRMAADAAQLKQVFLNILLNSIQAMPQGGTITVTMTEDNKHAKRTDKRDFVGVIISDTGSGIPAKDLPKVFDPFYTTKETGTGLGLSIAYGIVSKHGGEIEIASAAEKPNTGTTVMIRLPKAAH